MSRAKHSPGCKQRLCDVFLRLVERDGVNIENRDRSISSSRKKAETPKLNHDRIQKKKQIERKLYYFISERSMSSVKTGPAWSDCISLVLLSWILPIRRNVSYRAITPANSSMLPTQYFLLVARMTGDEKRVTTWPLKPNLSLEQVV